MPQSQSCIFNTSNPTACLETPPQSPNKKSMSENSNESTTSTTESETGKTTTNTTTNTTSKAPTTPGGSSKPKWKPLLIDAPKRERKSYRPSQGNNSTRSSYRNKDNNNNDMNSSTDENAVSSKRSNRAKSLDRHQDNDSNDKNSLPVNDTNNQNGEVNNKSRSKQSHSKSSGGNRLNKSMTESTNSSKNFTSKNTSQEQRPVQRNFNGAPAKGNGYRGGNGNSQQQYMSLPIQRQNGNGKSNGKRETHKDYLYGEDSIIVEEVPVLMPLAPNGMYHQGVMPMLMHPMEHQSMIHQTHNAYNVHSNEHSSLVHQPQQPGMFYNPMYTEEQTKEFVRHQIEYYFSDENLQNDLFLRKKMDMLGYIPLSVIASFNRVKSLSQDFNQIVASLAQSDSLEITPVYDQATGKLIENYLVRCKSNPTKWPMHSPLPIPSNNVSPPANLNPFVPEFVPSFSVSGVEEKAPAATAVVEKQKSKPVTITRPSFERMLSSR